MVHPVPKQSFWQEFAPPADACISCLRLKHTSDLLLRVGHILLNLTHQIHPLPREIAYYKVS